MRKTLENPANFFKKNQKNKTPIFQTKQNKNNDKPVRKKLQHLQNSGKEEKIDVPTFFPPCSGPNHLL